MSENRVTTADLSSGCRQATASPNLVQWDRGQILKLTGVTLPLAYNVEFTTPSSAESVTMLGDADGVEIPDALLETGEPIVAYVVLHDTVNDRESEYWITIVVRTRQRPEDIDPDADQMALIDQLVAALDEGVDQAEAAAAQAEAAVEKYPRVINGNWYVWNEATEEWIDTEVPATGPTGVGIASVTLNNDYTLTLTFTDGDDWTSPVPIRGAQGATGATGATPNMTIGTVSTLQPGSSASASITGTPENPVLNLGIPQGAQGTQGDPAPSSAIVPAVDDWLDTNVTQETGYVLDRTLQMANAAAPADLVGDLKSAIGNASSIEYDPLTFKWERKEISQSNGTSSSSTQVITSENIASIKGLKPLNNYQVKIHVYDGSDNYLGVWTGNAITSNTFNYLPFYFDLSAITEGYKVYACLKAKNSANINVDAAANLALYGELNEVVDDVDELSGYVVEKQPRNLLEYVDKVTGLRWMANSTAFENASSYTLTNLIPAKPNTYYSFSDSVSYAAGFRGPSIYWSQFDENGEIILQSGNGYARSLRTGATTKFIRVSYETALTDLILTESVLPIYKTSREKIEGLYKAVTADEVAYKSKNQQYKNLLDGHRDSLILSKQLIVSGANLGTFANNANYISLTDYIECEASTEYAFAFTDQLTSNPTAVIAWYDATGTYVSGDNHANNTTFTSPSTAKYFRISAIQLNTNNPNGHADFSNAFFAKCSIPYGPPAIDINNTFDDIFPLTSLKGKTWAVFGDSITEKSVRSTVNYHDYIRAETGINVINKGVGGSGYKCRWQNDNNIFAIAESFDFTGVDVVTCMAGINDSWSDLTSNMGNADDVYDTEETAENQSVMACFNRFLDVVIASAPFAKIGIISPLPCWTTQSSTDYHFKPDDDTSTLAVFIEKCKVVCKNRGIPYLDLFHTSGLRPWDSTVNNALFKCNASDSPDGLHPNHLGHKYFYPLVREFIKQLI